MNTHTILNKANQTKIIGMVKKAIEIIRAQSAEITQFDKPAYPGKNDPDFCTNADLAAQKFYLEEIQKNFPGYGVIGEEEGLRIPCTLPDIDLTFIVDPLDGTKAYKRGQAHGIGTMIALVETDRATNNKVVIAAYVGNVNTGEVIGYNDLFGEIVHERFGYTFTLPKLQTEPLNNSYIMIDKMPWTYPPQMMHLLKDTFKGFHLMNGSIGTYFGRLWTGEVAAVVAEPARAPWDWAPLVGINYALGLVHLKWNDDAGKLERYEPEIFTDLRMLPHKFEIVTYEQYADEIIATFNN